jgi:negative regulator of genetic competence, sporulation and motility
MSKWSKEDRNIFNNSEVFSNLESDLVGKIFKLSEIIKESQDASTKVKDMAESLDQASESAKELKNTMDNFAEDDMEENLEDLAEDDSEDKKSDNEDVADFAVKVAMISDLEKMAKEALSSKNYSDLYKIERAIQEIKDNG